MKILYHHRVASKDGQYVHIAEIVGALRDLGHEVILAEPASIQKKSFGKSSNTVSNIRKYVPDAIHELAEFAYSLFDFLKLVRLILKHRPDGIYERYNLFFPSGIWAKKLFKIPLILEINSPLFEERSTHGELSLKRLAQWSELYVWRNADFVLPVTQVLAESVISSGVSAEKLQVIHNGINRLKFSQGGTPFDEKVLERFQGALVLGFTGFARDWHGLDRVLDVVAANPDENWHFLLVGDGPAVKGLCEKASKLNLDDKFTVTGIVERDMVASIVTHFDIALQPDVVSYASPLKLFEYMMLGKAILAPDSANVREIVQDGETALLFDPDDASSFTRKLNQLTSDEGLRAQLGDGAYREVENRQFYWDANARKIGAIFLDLSGQRMIRRGSSGQSEN